LALRRRALWSESESESAAAEVSRGKQRYGAEQKRKKQEKERRGEETGGEKVQYSHGPTDRRLKEVAVFSQN